MERRYVGIDFHRRRSVIFIMTRLAELSCVRIANEPVRCRRGGVEAGDDAEVVIEATYGWYWAVDLLQDHGSTSIWRIPRAMTGASVG